MDPNNVIATFIALILTLAIFLIPPVLIIWGIIKLIKKVLRRKDKTKKGHQKENLTHSQDWLTRAQARQEIRFQNSLPPQRSEQKPQKKTWSMRRNEKKGKSAMGWVYNEETQLWEPPKHLKK